MGCEAGAVENPRRMLPGVHAGKVEKDKKKKHVRLERAGDKFEEKIL